MKKPDFNLRPGTCLRGKWNGNAYTIIKVLGSGACGTVFLCHSEQGDKYALKLGTDSSRLMLEVNMLKKFGKVQGVKLGPSFVDVDDWSGKQPKAFPFYVMEYIEGQSLSSFLQGKTKDWIGICAIQLLSQLEHLHKAGYVFGDLKTDNLLMSESHVRWIDVGGVTMIGRAIKEYTEFYDRGYWGMGTRKAEPSYDLFSVTMIMLEMAYPKRFDKAGNPNKTLESKLVSSSLLRPYQRFIMNCWNGKYRDAADMKKALSEILMKRKKPVSLSRVQRKREHEVESKELLVLSLGTTLLLGVSIISFWI
ncbi:protein kinase [Halobacillus sp. BBL2006]|uniref:protein kinase domain-containing protein n=1 Tax=Halobacillus sp. BBL2006 TaxID=1543706 RepID=UPI000541B192|nr:protein kinase [Halobacillus sp. BBL2006]KHE72174.1 serine/threonine protein kinase [Halobacillus sp. BBL2006]